MKIFMLIDAMDVGGAETHVFELSRILVKRGHDVAVISAGGRMTKALEEAGVRHITMQDMALPRAWAFVAKCIKREKPHMVHAHTRRCAFMCRMLLEHMSFPLTVTAHAMFSHTFPLDRLSFFPPSTIAVSEDIREALVRYFSVRRDDVSVIPNGIDTERFCQRPVKADEPLILSVSRLDTDCARTAHLLCRIMPELCRKSETPWRLMLVGGGSALPLLRPTASRVNNLLGREAIVLAGARTDIPDLLAQCRVFVGVSRAALEAMAMAKPVILSGDEGYLGLLDDRTLPEARRSNFCARGHAPATAERLLSDLLRLNEMTHQARTELGVLGHSIVHSTYTAEHLVDETLAVYARELARHRTARRSDAVICGYYGYGNCGDELVLRHMIDQQKNLTPDLRLTVLTAHGKPIDGVRSVPRYDPHAILREIRHTGAFILGGGSLLQDATSRRSLTYYLTLLSIAHAYSIPTMLYANGIGPLTSASLARCRRLLSSVDVITLRDTDSYRLIRSMNLPHTKVLLGADPVLSLPSTPTTPGSTPYLALFPKGNAPHQTATLQAVADIAKTHHLDIILASMSRAEDTASVHRAAAYLSQLLSPHALHVTVASSTPRAIVRLIARSTLVISNRLHALILAFRSGIPCVGFGTDPKIFSFLRDAALSPSYAPTPAALPHAALYALANPPSPRQIAILRTRAQTDAQVANALIRRF